MARTAKPVPLGSLTWEYLAKRFFPKEPPPQNQFFWPLQWKAGTKPGPAYPIDDEISRLLDRKRRGVRLDMGKLAAKGILCPYHKARRGLVFFSLMVRGVTEGVEYGRQTASRFKANAGRAKKLALDAQRVKETTRTLQAEIAGFGDELRSLTWSAGLPLPGSFRRDHIAGNALRSVIGHQHNNLLGIADVLAVIAEQLDTQYAAIEKSVQEIAPAFKNEASRLAPMKADTKVVEFAFIERMGSVWVDLTDVVPSPFSSDFISFVDAAYQSLWDDPPADQRWDHLCRINLDRIESREDWDQLDSHAKKILPPGTRIISAEERKRELQEREARWLEEAREAVHQYRRWQPLLQSTDDEARKSAVTFVSKALLAICGAQGSEADRYLNSEGFSKSNAEELLAQFVAIFVHRQ